MFDLTTRLLPAPAAILLAAAAGAGAVWLYRRDRRQVPPTAGRWLLSLRAMEAVLLVFLLADPVIARRERVLERGELLLVVDASRSFSLTDRHKPPAQVEEEAVALSTSAEEVRGMSRRDLAARALSSGWLDELRGRFRVTLLSLARDLHPIESRLPAADGDATNLARPIAEEVARRARGQLAGVLLVTDGNHHAPGDSMEPREAARRLALLDVPLVCVGIGPREMPPDFALESVDATGTIFGADEVKAQVTIQAAGLPAAELPLTISENGAALKTVTVSVPAGEGLTRVPVSFPAGAPGRKQITFSFPPQPGEAAVDNNSRDAWIEVLSEKARVLLLDGSPRWEERYLRATWARDKGVELASFLVTPPPERRLPSGFPHGREELFANDVIVLGDVEPSLFTREETGLLRDFVTARGGTLVLIAGERAMPYRWAETPLLEVIPVELVDPPPAAQAGASLARDGAPLSLTRAGQASEITRLVPGREPNQELWELLPRPLWLSPAAGPRPGAEVLATAGGAPAFATRAHGAGRTLYCGIDSTWRWRYRFGDELHRRFWGQVVRWAVSNRLGAEDDHARIGTNAVVYEAPARVEIEAMLQSAPGKPLELGRVDAVIQRTSDAREARVRLEPVPRSGGRYRGAASLDEIGLEPLAQGGASEYRVRIDAPELPGYSDRQDRAAAAFVVEPQPDPELRDLACDEKLLVEMAQLTGGRFLPLSRFREAAGALTDRSHEVDRIAESSPWDHPGLLALLLLGLIATEWIVRKWRDLV